MARIAVSIDGVTLVAISCDGFDVVSVGIGGTRVDQEFATVHVSSSRYPGNGESTYLIWTEEVLSPGQTVTVTFAEAGPTLGTGKTIDELHPGGAGSEESNTEVDFKLSPAVMQELRAKPKVRSSWRFALCGPDDSRHKSQTTDAEHGFGFNVLWNVHRPDRASFSLHSYDLDSLEQRTPMRDHVRGKLEYGKAVELVVAD
ncbi:hypothetical protein [Hydrogenophaga sp. 5NK40-0174]|uniref:hypothetical protein n=1 Tax=Hydrogenophaga sp. 5NK40-0174 TaxID=3127649 RepID=UPI0033427D00